MDIVSLLQRETVTDGGLEKYPEAGSAANIGIMLVKPNAVPLAKVTSAQPPVFKFTLSTSRGAYCCCQNLASQTDLWIVVCRNGSIGLSRMINCGIRMRSTSS